MNSQTVVRNTTEDLMHLCLNSPLYNLQSLSAIQTWALTVLWEGEGTALRSYQLIAFSSVWERAVSHLSSHRTSLKEGHFVSLCVLPPDSDRCWGAVSSPGFLINQHGFRLNSELHQNWGTIYALNRGQVLSWTLPLHPSSGTTKDF